MGNIVSGLVGGVTSLFTGGEKGRRYERAGRKGEAAIAEGQDYVRNGSGLSAYSQTGQDANGQIAGLLGVGGDPAASAAGYDNYLSSSGYQSSLQAGQEAITGSAAAAGKLNSGATGKALTRFGQENNQNYFSKYLTQLGGLSTQGLSASQQLAGSAASAAGQTASTLYNAETGSAEARDEGYSNALGGFGYAAGGVGGGGGNPFIPGGWG